MITPRTTRLLRVPDLQAMHRLLAVIVDGLPPDARPPVVIVPTTGAREALTRTLERRSPSADRLAIVTRDELYSRWHERLTGAPPLLSVFEREVLLSRAAAQASEAGDAPPFKLRAGLVREILAFYDELRRRDRTVADFDRLTIDSLLPSVEFDRGAERMYRQTRFLTRAFNAFEQLVDVSGGIDEHGLRQRLLTQDGVIETHAIVTVADQAADTRGLWTADFDLLARMRGLERLDVIATENLLAAGFHQRIHDVLPGIEEERAGVPAPPPVLVTPEPGVSATPQAPARWFVCRDREEELAAVVRTMPVERAAVVFQRPLPYLYLARYVFADADRSYQAVDSLPLAGEPFAAALDLVFAFLVAEANRTSLVDLLGSPHWRFDEFPGGEQARERLAALDAKLRELKYLGGWDRLAALAHHLSGDTLLAAASAADALRPVREAATASEQIAALLAFIHAHERPAEESAPWHSRHQRARAAVLEALARLAQAHARHDDRPMPIDRLAGDVRSWIEGQTFAPRSGSEGVTLLDAPAAAYADVDELRIVGLVEQDWPERNRRSIFYPSSLLGQLGWPNERDRLAAARARFQDLLRLPRTKISASTFTLEDDAIVPPSSFLEELETSGLAVERVAADTGAADSVFAHAALFDGQTPDALSGDAAAWLSLRVSRSPADDSAYHGAAGPRPAGVYGVSHVERYLACPFKYFAGRVLRLDEERDDESGLSPLERGRLLHEVFEAFFARWNERGRGSITADSLDEALELFASVAESTLSHLPEADRALERNYLLGSAAAAGLGERAFTFEIEQEVGIVERLLEHPLEGEFEFAGSSGRRRLNIRSKADRIDLLEDGTLRIIDYKLGRAPKSTKALQLPIYGVCASQHLEGRRGRSWPVSRAGYVAFKEKNAFVSLGNTPEALEDALADGEERLVAAIEGIERGEFPVKPEEPFLCTRCGYSGVCRKDYIGDE